MNGLHFTPSPALMAQQFKKIFFFGLRKTASFFITSKWYIPCIDLLKTVGRVVE